ncbi:serine hydrolase domain-containing protein [soil metagenome]
MYALGRFPDPPTDALSDATIAELQAILDAAVGGRLPGLTATVLVADRGAWSSAAGRGDRDDAMETRSQFGIGSITKTVVAAAVLRLAEEGVLRLSDPVSDHLPASIEFDTNGATVEDLLSMESGIPDPANVVGGHDPLREWHLQEILDSVPSYRAQPNERFEYSNTSYILLGLVIEEKTGTSVAAALRADVLSDPRLDTLVYQPEERPAGPLALPLHRSDSGELGGGYLSSMAWVTSGGGAGCMASDSGPLALWGYLLFGGDILSDESLLAMTDFGTDGYGLGTFDLTELADGFDVPAVGNGGWDDGGYSTVLSVLPSRGVVISVMTNVAGDPKALVLPVAQRLASALQD